MNELRIAAGILTLLASCSGSSHVAPVIPKFDDTPSCGSACARMRELGCAEAQPLEDGTSCEVFCVRTQEAGHALVPSCVQNIRSCDEIGVCTR